MLTDLHLHRDGALIATSLIASHRLKQPKCNFWAVHRDALQRTLLVRRRHGGGALPHPIRSEALALGCVCARGAAARSASDKAFPIVGPLDATVNACALLW
jgi:hypothetical protein